MITEKKTKGRKKKVEVLFKTLKGENEIVYFEIHDDEISLSQEMKEKLQLSIINSLKHGEYVFNKTTAEKYLEKFSNINSLERKLDEKDKELQNLKIEIKRNSFEYEKLKEKLDSIPNFLKNIFGK